jgi:hypothetical protein
MKHRNSAALLALLLLVGVGCAEVRDKIDDPSYVPNPSELTAIANQWPDGDPAKPTVKAIALARYGTAQAAEAAKDDAEAALARAQATREAAEAAARRQYAMMTAEAQQTAEAHQRTLEQQRQHATQQAANATQVAQATAQAVAVEATREAMRAQATATERAYQGTATRQAAIEARDATATARAEAATVTAAVANTRATATAGARQERATATAAAILAERERMELQRQRWLQPVRTAGPVLLILAGVVALAWIGWRAAVVIEDRARVIRRRGDEGEPIVLVTRERLALPMRQFNPLMVAERGNEHAPELAPPEYQEGATARQQAANLETARHAHQHQGSERVIVLPAGEDHQSRTRRRGEPGLLGVTEATALEDATEAGLLPRPLADAIEAEWREVEDA